jgi:hypothetical protein
MEMAKLIYAAIASLDGYVEDEDGTFDRSAPDDEVHAFASGPVDEYHLFLCPVVAKTKRRNRLRHQFEQ